MSFGCIEEDKECVQWRSVRFRLYKVRNAFYFPPWLVAVSGSLLAAPLPDQLDSAVPQIRVRDSPFFRLRISCIDGGDCLHVEVYGLVDRRRQRCRRRKE